MACNTFAGIQSFASAVQWDVIHNVLLHQLNLGPNKILRSECVQNRRKFEIIVEMIKRSRLHFWKKMCNSIYEAYFISDFFKNAKRTVELAHIFFFFL